MAGHVDVRVVARASLERVWAVANDPVEWARAGHPVRDVERRGDRLRFRAAGALVERVEDRSHRTVYSRRLESGEFVYCHLWFGYETVADGTELRCVADFELAAGSPGPSGRPAAPDAAEADAEMEAVVARTLRRNLESTARLAER